MLAMKTKLSLLCLSLVLAVAGLAACDKASPVAPAGTVLSVTANPTQIPANGASQVRVVALRANGTPVNPGTQIRMSTSLGTIDPLVEVGEGGVAIGTLQGDGRIGTATVTASVGAETTATVEVAVGRPAANISLQASPAQVTENGGTVDLLAVVRDDTGEPLADAAVNFQTEVGTLTSRGAIKRTNANGQVSDRLVVTSDDMEAVTNLNAFSVTAVVGTSAGGTTEDSVQVRIARCEPDAEFTAVEGDGQTVTISNTTTGEDVTYAWNFGGEIQQDVETLRNSRDPGTITYVQPGVKQISLEATNECGTSNDSQQVNPQP